MSVRVTTFLTETFTVCFNRTFYWMKKYKIKTEVLWSFEDVMVGESHLHLLTSSDVNVTLKLEVE